MALSRRALLRGLALLAGGPVAAPGARLRVVAVGAHPDDPESGCGGTLARYARRGDAVTVVYLTRGEAGIAGRSPAQSAAVRTAEARAACRLLGARPRFFGQVDGATVLDAAAVGRMERLLRAEAADVVLAPWPIDVHLDHAVAGGLVLQALAGAAGRVALFFYEVMPGVQTLGFVPTTFVDITETRAQKRAALLAHASQPVERVYRELHGPLEERRGREAGVAAAEAFVGFPPYAPPGRTLPGL